MAEPLSTKVSDRLQRAVTDAYLELMFKADGRLHAEIAGVVEAEVIRLSLNRHRGNYSKTAQSLGINRNTLLKLRRRYGVTA